MESKSKKFIIVFFVLIFLSTAFSYYTFIIKNNFDIFTDKEVFDQALLEE